MAFIALYIVIVMLVIEIAAVLMRTTGLERDIARFQVVSLLTGTGFTTKESELILGHPVRRRIGIFLILFGGFSFAVVVSAIATIMAPGFRLPYLAVSGGALALVWLVLRSPRSVELLTKKFTKPLEETFEVRELPIQDVLLREETDDFLEVPIGPNSDAAGRTMNEICADGANDRCDLNLLYIKRGELCIRKERMDTPLEPGDVLYVYGDARDIESRFSKELAEKKSEGWTS